MLAMWHGQACPSRGGLGVPSSWMQVDLLPQPVKGHCVADEACYQEPHSLCFSLSLCPPSPLILGTQPPRVRRSTAPWCGCLSMWGSSSWPPQLGSQPIASRYWIYKPCNDSSPRCLMISSWGPHMAKLCPVLNAWPTETLRHNKWASPLWAVTKQHATLPLPLHSG